MTFSRAFKMLMKNKCMVIKLPHWSFDVAIKIISSSKNSDMTAPYLYVSSRYGTFPWIPTITELFSNEWETL